MQLRTILDRAVLLSLLTGFSSCAGLSGLFTDESDVSLRRVDGLLADIERVHVETVLVRKRMADAVESLGVLAGPDFGGDALASYAAFVDAIDRSEQQAAQLSASIEPMKASAQAVFVEWTADLAAFRSEEMAEHSRQRLDQTRERYGELLTRVEPAQQDLAIFNGILRDHALFLGHDFNASSVEAIEAGLATLQRRVAMLDQQFASSQEAAQDYVQAAALRGQVVLSRAAVRDGTVVLAASDASARAGAADVEPGDGEATDGAEAAGAPSAPADDDDAVNDA